MKNLFLSLGLILASSFISLNASAQVEVSKGAKIKFNKEKYVLFRESDLLAVFKDLNQTELPF